MFHFQFASLASNDHDLHSVGNLFEKMCANLTLNIFLYLIFRNTNLWYFEKILTKIISTGSWDVKKNSNSFDPHLLRCLSERCWA